MYILEDGRVERQEGGNDVEADAFALLDHALVDLVVAF